MSAAAPLEFLDTNILVYAFSTDARCVRAEDLLRRGCTVSVQALNEFANVARRKLGMDWGETGEALSIVRTLCARIVPIDIDTHALGMALALRHGFAVFDAIMLAGALRAECTTFWSEDLQSGMLVEERLRVENPFR